MRVCQFRHDGNLDAERSSRTAIQVGQQLVFYSGVAGCTNLPSMPVGHRMQMNEHPIIAMNA
jgi:hypothetical protein